MEGLQESDKVDLDIGEICKKMDSFYIEELEIMEEYIRCKIELEKLMKAGFFNIAKARYIMGKTSVSSLQLPTEDASDVTALFRVSLDAKSDTSDKQFQLVADSKEQSMPIDITGPFIRKRGVSDENKSVESKSSNTTDSDPLKWFGVLVPQNLKQAQVDFCSALPLMVECANIQMKLIKVLNKYHEAAGRKLHIFKAS